MRSFCWLRTTLKYSGFIWCMHVHGVKLMQNVHHIYDYYSELAYDDNLTTVGFVKVWLPWRENGITFTSQG